MRDRLDLESSYGLDRKLSQAEFHDFEGVKRAYDKLLEIDLAIKTGVYSDKFAMEVQVTELACLNPLVKALGASHSHCEPRLVGAWQSLQLNSKS